MMQLDMLAPVAHRRRKARPDTHRARDRFVRTCMLASLGSTSGLMAVIWEGRVVAWVGSFDGRRALAVKHEPWMHARHGLLFGASTYDDFLANAIDSGQYWHEPWAKTLGAGPGTHWAHEWALQGSHCGLYDGTALIAKDRTDQSLGALWHGGDVSPKTKTIVSGGGTNGGSPDTSSNSTVFVLYDFVRGYDNIVSSASLQSMTNTPSSPTRWCGAGDVGLQIMSVTLGVNGNVSYSAIPYTNLAGSSGQAADVTSVRTVFYSGASPTTIDQWPSAFEYGGGESILDIGLVTGDTGVKSIDSITFGATGSTVGIILGRKIAWMPAPLAGYYQPIDFMKQAGEDLIVIPDKACLTHAKYELTLGHTNIGSLNFIWG